jgi:hypothetical protein
MTASLNERLEMSKIFAVATIPVQRTRKTPPSGLPFGFGLIRSVPYAGRQPFTANDDAEVTSIFGDKPVTTAPSWIERLADQIKSDLVRIQELGKRQDSLAPMMAANIKPIRGGSPEAPRFVPSEQDLEDVFGSPSCGDDAQFMTAAG